MLPAPWRALVLKAAKKNGSVPSAKYVQLATVKPSGRPSNRTIVFRGFLGDGDELTFVTDARSTKVEEVARCPFAEACWYLPVTREQFRLSGEVRVIDAACGEREMQEARGRAWRNMSESGRKQFAWPSPGVPLPEPGSPPEPDNIAELTADAAPPLDTFCLVVLRVEGVDWLQLKGNQRTVFHRTAEGWDATDVSP